MREANREEEQTEYTKDALASLADYATGDVKEVLIDHPDPGNQADADLGKYASGKVWSQDQRETEELKQALKERDVLHRHNIRKDAFMLYAPWIFGLALISIFSWTGITSKDKEVKPWALAAAGTVLAACAQFATSTHIAKEAAKEAITSDKK